MTTATNLAPRTSNPRAGRTPTAAASLREASNDAASARSVSGSKHSAASCTRCKYAARNFLHALGLRRFNTVGAVVAAAAAAVVAAAAATSSIVEVVLVTCGSENNVLLEDVAIALYTQEHDYSCRSIAMVVLDSPLVCWAQQPGSLDPKDMLDQVGSTHVSWR